MNESNQLVILAYGPQPASFFADASKLTGDGAVISPDVARMAGATFAVGNPAELDALRKRLEDGALQRERADNPGLSAAAVRWLACGERGISSNFIFTRLTGIDAMQGWGASAFSAPSDPSDFRRCQLMLEAVPELGQRLHEMAHVSPVWAELVRVWPDIIAAMDEEAPGWRDPGQRMMVARRAYELIQKATGR